MMIQSGEYNKKYNFLLAGYFQVILDCSSVQKWEKTC